MKLSKSQRIKIIQDVAKHLELEDWTTVDLTLKGFGFPITDQWSGGDKKSYIIEMLGEPDDADLIELGQHLGMPLGGPASNPADAPETPYWHDGQLRVFISHLTAHREQAANIQDAMKWNGMSGFVAHNDINPTVEWQIEIETALATCDILIALIHPDFVQSKWCDQEIGYALGRGIPVFTVRCGEDPHGFISRFQAFNGNGKTPHQIAKELFEAAIDHKKLQEKMADVVIDLFIISGSFASARERVGYVERLKVWDATYSGRIQKAVKTNSQIASSWGVSEKVDELVKKWK